MHYRDSSNTFDINAAVSDDLTRVVAGDMAYVLIGSNMKELNKNIMEELHLNLAIVGEVHGLNIGPVSVKIDKSTKQHLIGFYDPKTEHFALSVPPFNN